MVSDNGGGDSIAPLTARWSLAGRLDGRNACSAVETLVGTNVEQTVGAPKCFEDADLDTDAETASVTSKTPSLESIKGEPWFNPNIIINDWKLDQGWIQKQRSAKMAFLHAIAAHRMPLAEEIICGSTKPVAGESPNVRVKRDGAARGAQPGDQIRKYANSLNDGLPAYVSLPEGAPPKPMLPNPLVPLKKRLIYHELSYISDAVSAKLKPTDPIKKRPTGFLEESTPSVLRAALPITGIISI
eukprot:CAMPEP_0176032472 /NCGR_PEP_ID=MMETSP0120_2-20121206/16028_1 /TAXON_ID=160619 /ORGANISM="Kryptoperidinium foliaceum, Strain CCMP 1326" /LENGTH=242 /DNA_ID=CAMNT_0017365789 /DNA_START=73 /DNA_END=802 /DNA_ORIENTATION=-